MAEGDALADDDLHLVEALAPLDGYVVVRAGHPLLGGKKVVLADVLRYPFVRVVTLPPRLLKPILHARPAHRNGVPLPPFPAIECSTARLATRIVAATNAFTFATLGMIEEELGAGRIVPLVHEPWLHTSWNVVRLRSRSMSSTMGALAEEVVRTQAELVREEQRLREAYGLVAHSDVRERVGQPRKARSARAPR